MTRGGRSVVVRLGMLGVALMLGLASLPAHAQVAVKDDRLSFGPEMLDFATLTRTIAEFCKVNIMLPDGVKETEKIGVLTKNDMGRLEAWQTYFLILDSMGVTYSQVGSYKKFAAAKDITQVPSALFVQNLPASAQQEPHVTLLYETRHASPEDIKKVLDPMLSRSGKLSVFQNKLLFFERAAYLPRLLGLIDKIDVGGADTHIYYYQATYSPIGDISNLIEQLFMKGGGDSNRQLSGLSKLVTDERTNTLFIVGSEGACKQVVAFVPKLDLPIDRTSKMEVVFLKHAKAEDLQTTLQTIISAPGQKKSGKREFNEDLEIKVQADKGNNALILIGSTRGIHALKTTIAQLDKMPKQVFLEAVILEVATSDTKSLGASFVGARKVNGSYIMGGTAPGSLNAAAIDASSLTGIALGVRGPDVAGSGDAYGLGYNFPSFGALVRMLQETSQVNILSNPYLIATDKEEAQVLVGSNVPFITGSSRDSNNQPILSVQRQDVAMTVKLKPEIGDNRGVKLKIEVQTEDIASLSETLGPTTTKRSIKSIGYAQSGSRLALGGLVQTRDVKNHSTVPFFGQLPLIGYLLSSKTDTKEKTNLLIVVTPTVVENQEDLRTIFKHKLDERREYIKEIYGHEDGDYGVPKDFHDRVGIAETVRQVIEAEKLEEASREVEPTITITPETAEKLSREHPEGTSDDGSDAPVQFDMGSPPPPEQTPEAIPVPPEPPVPVPPPDPAP